MDDTDSTSTEEKCIRHLQKAKSDNEKFAALLMVVKVFNAEKCGKETSSRLFHAIGTKFIVRLLRTGTVPEGCSEYTFKALALNLLSFFCSDPSVANDSAILGSLPYFNEILSTLSNDTDPENQQMIEDCYQCLQSLVQFASGRQAMLHHRTVTTLCQCFVEKYNRSDKALELLKYIIHFEQSDTWKRNKQGLEILLEYISLEFKENKDDRKFELCGLLTQILASVNKNQIEALSKTWQENLHIGLVSIIQSKIGPSQREPALKLAGVAIESLGVPWIFGQEPNQKYLLLLVHLTCIEVRMTLEDHTFQEISAKSDLLCCCYSTLENIINYMINCPNLGLESKQVTQLHSAMVGAFNAVIYFLGMVDAGEPEQLLAPIVLATVRVLGAWIAEESTSLQQKVQGLIPFLMRVCKESKEIHHLRVNPEEQGIKEPQAGTEEIVSENSMVVPQSVSPMIPIDSDILKFLLPGLCNLTHDTESRKLLLENQLHVLLYDYLKHEWDVYIANDKPKDLEVSLVSTCSVLMNITVIEEKFVTSESLFKDICQFTIQGLATMGLESTHLIVKFNMMVLGLLLLRIFHKDLETTPLNDMKQFFSTVISLLRHAHGKKQMAKTKFLFVISEAYLSVWEEIEELWILGMTALSGCMNEITVIQLPHLVLNSGWIPTAMKLLQDVPASSIPPQTVDAYSSLFKSLVKADPANAKKVILSKDGVSMCRKYYMDELQILLGQ